MTKEWDSMSMADKAAHGAAGTAASAVGVEATEEMLRFLWNSGFAAVAGDAFAFEVGISRSEGKYGYALNIFRRSGHHKVLFCCTSTYLQVGGCQ